MKNPQSAIRNPQLELGQINEQLRQEIEAEILAEHERKMCRAQDRVCFLCLIIGAILGATAVIAFVDFRLLCEVFGTR